MTKGKTHNTSKGDASPGSKTPQPQKALNKSVNKKPKTPKSEPQPKRKKLSEEISDDEFEKLIKDVKADELKKAKEGRKTPRPKSPKKSPKKGGSEDEETSSDDSDFDIDAIQFDSNDDGDDSSDDNDAAGSEDEEEADSDDQEKTNPLADKFKELINGKDGMYSDDSSDDEDEDEDGSEQDSEDGESGDSDEDGDSEEEPTPPGKKLKQKAVKKLKQATKQESDEESDMDESEDVPEPSKKSKKQKDKKDLKSTKKETGVKRKADEDASGEPKAKLTKSDLMADQKARDEQNSRSLFLMLPGQLSQDEVRELLPKPMRSKITDVRIHTVYRKKKKAAGKQVVRAYLEFNTVEQVDKAYAALKDAKLKNEPIIVDYVGTKSLNKPTPANTDRKIKPSDFDPLRLFIGGFDRDPSTEEELKEHFPTASKLQCPKPKDKNKLVGFAFAHYTSEAVCKAAHEQNQNLVLRDRKLRVMFARKASAAAKAGHKMPKQPKQPKQAAGEDQSPKPEKQQSKKKPKNQKLNNKDSQQEKKVEKSPQEERKQKKKSGKKVTPQEVIDDVTMSD